MSDNIPFEIQVQILKKLPVKSLIQFRSVSKQWKALIDSSDFILDHAVCSSQSQPQHLLIRYGNWSSEAVYVSFVDDHTFPNNKSSPTVPTSVRFTDSEIIGTSHGLICLFLYSRKKGDSHVYSERALVVRNPFIRKSVTIAIPKVHQQADETDFRFGVCSRTCDPKIVMIYYTHTVTGSSNSHWQVEVFALRSGVWRSLIGNLPSELVQFDSHRCQEVIDGSIYWIGNSIETSLNLLISFDLSCEEFREILLPVELASYDPLFLHLHNRRDSVAVLKWCYESETCEVWMMENNSDSKSFVKLFSFKMVYGLRSPVLFRRNGELVMIIDHAYESEVQPGLVVYDHFSKHFSDLGIGLVSVVDRVFIWSGTESLILLDQRDTLIDGDDAEMSGEQEETFEGQTAII